MYNSRIIYKPGQMVDFDDMVRVQSLLDRGLAEVIQSAEVISAVNINQSAAKIKDEVLACSDLDVLKNALEEEQNSEKPRKGVIQVINERISEL